jgi:membrane protein required for colicin V production
MHVFDIVAAVIAAMLMIVGIKRGLIAELFRLLAIATGFISALMLYHTLYEKLKALPLPQGLTRALSFLLIYATTALLVLLVGWIVRKVAQLSLMGWADHLLGGIIGLIKAVMLLWLCTILIDASPLDTFKKSMAASRTYALIRIKPRTLPLPGVGALEQWIFKSLDTRALRSLQETQRKFNTFRNRIEAIKHSGDTI